MSRIYASILLVELTLIIGTRVHSAMMHGAQDVPYGIDACYLAYCCSPTSTK
jgi:hypothetical protein